MTDDIVTTIKRTQMTIDYYIKVMVLGLVDGTNHTGRVMDRRHQRMEGHACPCVT